MNKTFVFGIGTVVAGVLVFLLLFEAGLRVVFRHSMDFDIEMWKYATTLKRIADDPAVAHEHKPSTSAFLMGVDVRINANKLRDNPYEFTKPANVKRVLMLGDSLTFGWGVPFGETTSKLLERRLNESDDGLWQVINAGVGNYNTSQEVAYFLNEGRKYNPDVVVLNYFVNDAEPTPARKGNILFGWSYAYVYLKGRIDVLARQAFGMQNWSDYYLSLYADSQPGWKKAVNSIEKLAAFCRERGIPLVIASYPELHDFDNYRFAKVAKDLNAIARRVDARFADLLDAVRDQNEPDLWITVSDPHPNGRANRLFAKALHSVVARAAGAK